jgi:hypothetical protein
MKSYKNLPFLVFHTLYYYVLLEKIVLLLLNTALWRETNLSAGSESG